MGFYTVTYSNVYIHGVLQWVFIQWHCSVYIHGVLQWVFIQWHIVVYIFMVYCSGFLYSDIFLISISSSGMITRPGKSALVTHTITELTYVCFGSLHWAIGPTLKMSGFTLMLSIIWVSEIWLTGHCVQVNLVWPHPVLQEREGVW